ncbi:Creatinase/Aminopeptidase P [Auriculariales sp. MPI-PUGE-AT-0066]|nr:Creatinase/Aminopeptidase P [Auriculariales sp. MPI-PUGE-AT-0066]
MSFLLSSRATRRPAACYASLTRLRHATSLRGVKPAPYGQAQPSSHPHMLQPGEMTPGIQRSEYEARRARLMNTLPDGSIVVSAAASIKYMSEKIFYKYRQNSDFWYLTGWQEPNAAIVMKKDPSAKKGYQLAAFVAPKDEHAEKWDGARSGVDAAGELLCADDAQTFDSFSSHLQVLVNSLRSNSGAGPSTSRPIVFADVSSHWLPSRTIMPEVVNFFESRHSGKRSLRRELALMRAVKSPAEQQIMRAAANITAEAHRKV